MASGLQEQHVTLRIEVSEIPARVSLLHSVRLLRPNLITRLPATFGSYLKQCCNYYPMSEAASFSVVQSLPQGIQIADQRKLDLFLNLNKFYIIGVFDNQANNRCNIGSISRPVSSQDHNVTDHAIAMDRYQSNFGKLDSLFSGRKMSRRLTKNIVPFLSKLFHGGNNVQSTYITFDIFNNLIFIGTTEKANEK